MHILEYQKIKSYIFSPSDLSISSCLEHQKAYELWSNVWSETFRDLVGAEKVYSDDFLKSNEISALFYEDEPISVFVFNQVNMQSKAFQNLSYFKNYPSSVIEQLKTYENIMIMGYLTVAKEWRKSITNISFSDVHVGLAVKKFQISNNQALVSFTRNNRKVNDVVYRFGATGLLKDHTAHNVSVDYILIDKQSARNHPEQQVQAIIDHLWSNYQKLKKQETIIDNQHQLERRMTA
jgi:hypothetical protein